MKKWFIVTIAVALLLLLPGCSKEKVQVYNYIKGEPYANSNQYIAGNFTYSAADVDSVEIFWRAGNVELVESDEVTLNVSESGEDLGLDAQMYHWLDGRTLRIQFCQSSANIHVNSADKMLKVELPEGIDLSVYNTSSDIHAESLTQRTVFISSFSGKLDCGTLIADTIDVSSSSGGIQLEHISADSLEVTTTSGRVDVGNADVRDMLSCVSVSGSLTFDDVKAASAAIETTSANVEIGKLDCPSVNINSTSGKLKLPLPENGMKLNFVTVSGSLKTSLSYETVGELRFFGNGESEVNIVTISGDMVIK